MALWRLFGYTSGDEVTEEDEGVRGGRQEL